MSTDRFRTRYVGSTYGRLYVDVTNSGVPRNLTGETASLEIFPDVAGASALTAPLTPANTPGADGAFEWQLTAAHLPAAGEYLVMITMQLGGQTHIAVYRLRILATPG